MREQEHRELIKEYGVSELAGNKYEWLRNSAKTDNRTGDRPAFLRLSCLNLKTAWGWSIKEAASLIWDYVNMEVAKTRWKELLGWISSCQIESVKRVGRMIRSYFWGIVNAIRLKESKGQV